MYTISTQLAKAVFNIGDFFYKDNPTESVQIENGVITYTVGKSSFDKPVDSFFFMCKDWAIKQGYYLASNKYPDEACCQYFTEESKLCDNCGEVSSITIHAESEQQAVFDVCQWILDTKGL